MQSRAQSILKSTKKERKAKPHEHLIPKSVSLNRVILPKTHNTN